jgi:hypothetical protein
VGAHRAPSPNYTARRIGVAALVVAVVGVAVWFFFLRGSDPCEEYRERLLAEYEPMRGLQAEIIEALAPVDADEEMSAEEIAAARAIVDEMSPHRRAIENMSKETVPEPLQQDMFSLVPTLNEFFSLSDRTVEWLEGTLPSQPTETPSVQLQGLYDFLTPPDQITACP